MSLDGPSASSRHEIQSLRDLAPHQWKSGLAAWLGWLCDGLDIHLYVLVAAPFVAELIGASDTRNEKSASTAPGSRPRSWSAGRSGVVSSGASATASAGAGR